jgi:tRNA(fMet)-specific endonuclease VapC
MDVRYLVDTNICIYIAKHNPPAVRERFLQHAAGELAMSVITYGELRYGAQKSQAASKAVQIIDNLASVITIAELDASVGLHYGQIRAELEQQGRIIGNNDLWIAAHARARGWTIVTNNEREFRRVSALEVENWL